MSRFALLLVAWGHCTRDPDRAQIVFMPEIVSWRRSVGRSESSSAQVGVQKADANLMGYLALLRDDNLCGKASSARLKACPEPATILRNVSDDRN